MSKNKVKKLKDELQGISEHISATERVAQEAERQVESIKMAEYMSDRIGNKYNGIISGITNFGIFVELENLIEGLVSYKTMKGFYEFDPVNYRAVDVDTKNSFGIGDLVTIKVVNVNLTLGKIDFELESDDNEKEEG